MSRLVKIVDNKYIQIEEYRNPNICFNTNEYDDFENYCTLRETFDPFEIFYENQELKKQLEDKEDYINKLQATKDKLDKWDYENTMQQKEFIRYLKEKEKQFDMIGDPINSGACCGILNKYKEIIGDDK